MDSSKGRPSVDLGGHRDHVVEHELARLVRRDHERVARDKSAQQSKQASWVGRRQLAPHDAEDVVQQAAVELVDLGARRYFRQPDPDHRRRAVSRIYGRRLGDRSQDESERLQRETNRVQSIDDMSEHGMDPTLSIPDTSPEPLDLLLTIEAKNELLRHIPDRYRAVIAARLDGAGDKELAGERNVSEAAVRQSVKRGLDQARKSLEAAA